MKVFFTTDHGSPALSFAAATPDESKKLRHLWDTISPILPMDVSLTMRYDPAAGVAEIRIVGRKEGTLEKPEFSQFLTKRAKKYAEKMGFSLTDLSVADAMEITIMAGSSYKAFKKRASAQARTTANQ